MRERDVFCSAACIHYHRLSCSLVAVVYNTLQVKSFYCCHCYGIADKLVQYIVLGVLGLQAFAICVYKESINIVGAEIDDRSWTFTI